MKKRFTEKQVIRILGEAEAPRVQIHEVCRRHNVTEQTGMQNIAKNRKRPIRRQPREIVDTRLNHYGKHQAFILFSRGARPEL